MTCSLIDVWKYSWRDIWAPLIKRANDPDELVGDLVSWVVPKPRPPAKPNFEAHEFNDEGELIDPENNVKQVKYDEAFKIYQTDLRLFSDAQSTSVGRPYLKNAVKSVATEIQAREFLNNAYNAIEDEVGEQLSELVALFFKDRNVGYSLQAGFEIRPTMLGMFGRLRQQAIRLIGSDAHLSDLWDDFEEAYSELRLGPTQGRIRSCVMKQFIFVEALTKKYPGIDDGTFGQMSKKLDWPHPTMQEIGPKLYGFRSDYPGLGHAGNPQSALRELGMKDVVGLTLLLFSLTPYLTNELDFDACYLGSC